MKHIQDNLVPYLIFVLAAVLLFTSLSNSPLSQDEALVASLAKSVLSHGRPLSFDGRNHLLPECSGHHREDYTWTYGAWLQFYLTAASFFLFGIGNFSARVPFALFGWLAIWLFYSFCTQHLKNKRLNSIAIILLTLSVPFLLHLRLCRYFALNAFFTLAVLDAYLRMASRNKFSLAYFVISSTLLFHANYGTFPPMMLALLAHFLIFRLYRQQLRSFCIAFGSIFIFTLPWMIYLRVWQRAAPFSIQAYLGHIVRYGFYINDWCFPLVLALPLLVLLVRSRGQDRLLGLEKSTLYLLLLVMGATFLMLSSYDQIYLRYFIHLFPLFSIFLGLLLLKIIEKSKPVGYLLMVVLMTTNLLGIVPYGVLNLSPFKFSRFTSGSTQNQAVAPALGIFKREYYREGEDINQRFRRLDEFIQQKAGNVSSQLWLYLNHLTNQGDDTVARVVKYLNSHARDEDLLYTNTEHLPIMFYTDLIVQRPFWGNLQEHVLPEWVIIDLTDNIPEHQKILREIMAQGKYKKIDQYFSQATWFDQPTNDYPKFSLQKRKSHLALFRLERE